ncbi:hypothetical protein ACR4XJ_08780 [Nitratidesulfovibrio sp. D1]|uniref:hypothetical protein n=1 Tax=Nitratidesulfovibrio sp. D1 TaxID=3440151 RepID=UPI003EBBB832
MSMHFRPSDSTHIENATRTPTPESKRARKNASQLSTERNTVKDLLGNGVPLLKIRHQLGLTAQQLNSHIAALCAEGFSVQQPQYEVVTAKALPPAVQKQLGATAGDLVKCELNGTSLVLSVVTD